MSCLRSALLPILLVLLAPCAFAGDGDPDLAELWRVGSLWQVGENRDRVDEARKAIVQAGDAGLKFALTRLDVADTLQIRCLNAVFAGFGARAYEDLVANVSHDNATARRNVAELLMRHDDSKAGPHLLAQARKESDLGARLSQLAALSKWEVKEAVPMLIEVSGDERDRIRHRAAGLLGAYSTREAVTRLIELLDDDVYYVRDGAQAALAGGSIVARAVCLARLNEQLELPTGEQNLRRLRLLLPVIATLAEEGVPKALRRALAHGSGSVRGEAADAFASWKLSAGALSELDVGTLLKSAIENEYDPFARAAMEAAGERLAGVEDK
jgi:hypothetical protein